MLTQEQYQYVNNLVNTYVFDKDYDYYLVYNNDEASCYPNCSVAVFSKDISILNETNEYTTFRVNNGIKFNLYFANELNSSVVKTKLNSNSSITINSDISVYSNVKDSSYPNMLSYETYQRDTNLSYNISKNEFMIAPFLLAILILMLFFKWCFPMKGGKNI